MRALLVMLCGVLSIALAVALLLCAGPAPQPAQGQDADAGPFELKLEDVTSHGEVRGGVNVKRLTVTFTVSPRDPKARVSGAGYAVVISELGREVKKVPLSGVKVSQDLSLVAAIDMSGSMAEGHRIEQVRSASGVFFNMLPAEAEAGLILFNHQVKVMDRLSRDRGPLLQHIRAAQPSGGTAYVDATIAGAQMLTGAAGNRVIVVMTDGVDLNSNATLEKAIHVAKASGVKVYTVGIGEPGRQEKMTSVLVLDHSGSMAEPADDQDRIPKIDAAKKAANLFMSFIREGLARTTVLEFSDIPEVPQPFTSDKTRLRGPINTMSPKGETALFDAVYEAIAALEAERPVGKRAVVTLTDGVDNMSRRRVEEVIARAKEAKIPLYLLGFGRKGELDEAVMERMAKETGGQYYHAKNQAALMEIFEKLANRLHDDGINEADLKRLANETGGRYYHARDVNKIQEILTVVVRDFQKTTYRESFDDLVQVDDGREHPITLRLVRGIETVGGDVTGGVVVHGLIIPEANHFVYLGLLAVIGILIALPAGLRRMGKASS